MRSIRTLRSLAFAVACAGAVVASPASAAKKKTVPVPPLPNVLLLVDNSGSMEKMVDGTDPEANTFSGTDACTLYPGNVSTGAASTPNRWGTLLQALTGTFSNGYRCYKMDRNGASDSHFPL